MRHKKSMSDVVTLRAYIVPLQAEGRISITPKYVEYGMVYVVRIDTTDGMFTISPGARVESEPNQPPFMTVKTILAQVSREVGESGKCQIIFDPQNRTMCVHLKETPYTQTKNTEQKPMMYMIRVETLLTSKLLVEALHFFNSYDAFQGRASSPANVLATETVPVVTTQAAPVVTTPAASLANVLATETAPVVTTQPASPKRQTDRPLINDDEEEMDPVMRELELLLSTDAPL